MLQKPDASQWQWDFGRHVVMCECQSNAAILLSKNFSANTAPTYALKIYAKNEILFMLHVSIKYAEKKAFVWLNN